MTILPPICRALAMGLNEEFEKMRTAKEPDGRLDLITGWQLHERIKPYAVDNFYIEWRLVEHK